MDEAHKELVKRLREGDITMKCEDGVVRYCNHVAADALEALAGEVAQLKAALVGVIDFIGSEEWREAHTALEQIVNRIHKALEAKP